jgi:predicted TIM-barrel fold metal-dependent hydrolase
MTIPLFDVQCGFGSAAPGSRETITAEALVAEMDRLGIERALARTLPTAMAFDVPLANDRLFADCVRHPRLVPCPIAAPAAGRSDAPEAEQVALLCAHGAGAVVIRPRTDGWSTAPWGSDPLFAALEARRLPVLCPGEEVTLDEVAALAPRYPALPLIVTGANYRTHGIVLPLLMAFSNVYLSLGSNYIVHRGIEDCVRAVGAGRLLFGTGFPDVDMGGHVTHLLYAELSLADLAAIGAGNLDRLIGEVVR